MATVVMMLSMISPLWLLGAVLVVAAREIRRDEQRSHQRRSWYSSTGMHPDLLLGLTPPPPPPLRRGFSCLDTSDTPRRRDIS